MLRLHIWVKYFDDMTRLDGGQDLDDLRNHCDVGLESVARRPDDDDRNRPPLHRLLSLDSFVGGDQDGESGLSDLPNKNRMSPISARCGGTDGCPSQDR